MKGSSVGSLWDGPKDPCLLVFILWLDHFWFSCGFDLVTCFWLTDMEKVVDDTSQARFQKDVLLSCSVLLYYWFAFRKVSCHIASLPMERSLCVSPYLEHDRLLKDRCWIFLFMYSANIYWTSISEALWNSGDAVLS